MRRVAETFSPEITFNDGNTGRNITVTLEPGTLARYIASPNKNPIVLDFSYDRNDIDDLGQVIFTPSTDAKRKVNEVVLANQVAKLPTIIKPHYDGEVNNGELLCSQFRTVGSNRLTLQRVIWEFSYYPDFIDTDREFSNPPPITKEASVGDAVYQAITIFPRDSKMYIRVKHIFQNERGEQGEVCSLPKMVIAKSRNEHPDLDVPVTPPGEDIGTGEIGPDIELKPDFSVVGGMFLPPPQDFNFTPPAILPPIQRAVPDNIFFFDSSRPYSNVPFSFKSFADRIPLGNALSRTKEWRNIDSLSNAVGDAIHTFLKLTCLSIGDIDNLGGVNGKWNITLSFDLAVRYSNSTSDDHIRFTYNSINVPELNNGVSSVIPYNRREALWSDIDVQLQDIHVIPTISYNPSSEIRRQLRSISGSTTVRVLTLTMNLNITSANPNVEIAKTKSFTCEGSTGSSGFIPDQGYTLPFSYDNKTYKSSTIRPYPRTSVGGRNKADIYLDEINLDIKPIDDMYSLTQYTEQLVYSLRAMDFCLFERNYYSLNSFNVRVNISSVSVTVKAYRMNKSTLTKRKYTFTVPLDSFEFTLPAKALYGANDDVNSNLRNRFLLTDYGKNVSKNILSTIREDLTIDRRIKDFFAGDETIDGVVEAREYVEEIVISFRESFYDVLNNKPISIPFDSSTGNFERRLIVRQQ